MVPRMSVPPPPSALVPGTADEDALPPLDEAGPAEEVAPPAVAAGPDVVAAGADDVARVVGRRDLHLDA